VTLSFVMPGLVPGIHVLLHRAKDVDGRDEPGHDDELDGSIRFNASRQLQGLESLTSNFPIAPATTKSL
jgi:hypothetical protein